MADAHAADLKVEPVIISSTICILGSGNPAALKAMSHTDFDSTARVSSCLRGWYHRTRPNPANTISTQALASSMPAMTWPGL
jgi:hypothetical protein